MICKLVLFFVSLLSILCSNEVRVITLEYSPKLGVFASANQILGQLYLFETAQLPNVEGLAVDFDKYGLYYDPARGPNWWTYYFEPIQVGKQENVKRVYPTIQQYFEAWQIRRTLSRETAAKLVNRYVHINAETQQKIDSFAERFFSNHYMIGVHYRGTDKGNEAPRVDYDTVFLEIDKYIPTQKNYFIFIATDEIEFLDHATKRYGDKVIAIEAHRSNSGGEGVHFVKKNNYFLGEEAVMDACLLSKCDLLIRTSSSLSLWSTYFNPDLPVILLNQRHEPTLEPE